MSSTSTSRSPVEENHTQATPKMARQTHHLSPLEPVAVVPTLGFFSNKTTELPVVADDPQLRAKYALFGFALEQFLLVPPRKGLSSPFRRPKPFDLETRLRWEKELRAAPLTKTLHGEQIQIGLQAFRNISGFMGNRSSGKGQVDHCFKLLRNVMPRSAAIKDEIFCQLCKQLTGNPDGTAVLNGWLLLSACLVSFPPSGALSPHLERFVASHINSAEPKVTPFAVACLSSLHEWTAKAKHERKEIPSVAEIESLRDNTSVNMAVLLIDDTSLEIGVTSWTTCGELTEITAQQLGLSKRQAFSLFEVSAAGDERRVNVDERVLDLLALWERLGVETMSKKSKKQKKVTKKKSNSTNSGAGDVEPLSQAPTLLQHHLLFKVFLHVPIDDALVEDIELTYKQAIHDIRHGVVVCPLRECIQLAAYQLYVARGPFTSSSKTLDLSRELHTCMPSHVVSSANRVEVSARVQKAYAALSSGGDAEQISPQQIRLAYLNVCATLKLYGSTFFAVHNTRNRTMPPDLVLGVNHKGISLVSVANEAVLHHFPYVSIATWGYSSNAFVFVVATPGANAEDVEYVMKTKAGKAINDLVAAYIAYILACSSAT